jgi:hypothetical protein
VPAAITSTNAPVTTPATATTLSTGWGVDVDADPRSRSVAWLEKQWLGRVELPSRSVHHLMRRFWRRLRWLRALWRWRVRHLLGLDQREGCAPTD